MQADARERLIVFRLRLLIIYTLAIGLAAALLDPSRNALFIGMLCLPAAGAYLRPQWGPIAIWAMWAVPVLMLGLLVNIGRPDPILVSTKLLVAKLVLLVVVVLPLVRRSHRSRPVRSARVPQARVVRRRGVSTAR